MGDPKVYRKTPERSLTSFNFTDIVDGTGFVNLFLAQVEDEDSRDAILTPIIIDSAESQNAEGAAAVEINGSTASVSFVKVTDKDFDLTAFNLPRTIRGTALLNMGFALTTSTGTGQSFIVAKIRKWDGSTETELISGQTVTLLVAGADKFNNIGMTLVIPKTQFKKGETLRLTIEVWAKSEGGGTTQAIFGADPAGTDGTFIKAANEGLSTKSTLNLPFNIDL